MLWVARQMGMRHGLLRTSCSRNPENTSNPLIFLRKMATFRCFALHKVINFHASMKFMTFCRLSHPIIQPTDHISKRHSFYSRTVSYRSASWTVTGIQPLKIASRWAGCPQALCFHTVCAVNAQTWLNCNNCYKLSDPFYRQNFCSLLL